MSIHYCSIAVVLTASSSSSVPCGTVRCQLHHSNADGPDITLSGYVTVPGSDHTVQAVRAL